MRQKNIKSLRIDTEAATGNKLVDGTQIDENSPAESSQSSEDSFDWRSRRKTSDIIDSVKKRVAMHRSPATEQHSGIDSGEGSPQKNLSLDEKLEELVPERKCLSPEAQNCLSLDRNRGRSLFKSAPTYNTLECMFGPSVSKTTSIYGGFDSSHSLYSSFRSCRSRVSELPGRSEKSDTVDDEERKAIERECKHEDGTGTPTRPGYFKSISSPSKIYKFAEMCKSTAGSESSLDDNGDYPEGTEPCQTKEHYKGVKSKVPITLENGEADNVYRSESEELEEALKSPTLKGPFRRRSGALTVEERTRSSSAPSSPALDDGYLQVDVADNSSL